MNLKTFLWTFFMCYFVIIGNAQQTQNDTNYESVKWYLDKSHPFIDDITNMEIVDGQNFEIRCDFNFDDFIGAVFAITSNSDTISGNNLKINFDEAKDFTQLPICSEQGIIQLSLIENNGILENPISINLKNVGDGIPFPFLTRLNSNAVLEEKLGLDRPLSITDIGKTFQISSKTIIDSLDISEVAIFTGDCSAIDIVGVGCPPKGQQLGENNNTGCYRDTITWYAEDICGNRSQLVYIYLDVIDYSASKWYLKRDSLPNQDITGGITFDVPCGNDANPFIRNSIFIVTPCNDTIFSDKIEEDNSDDFSDFNEGCLGDSRSFRLSFFDKNENRYSIYISYRLTGSSIAIRRNSANQELAKKLGLKEFAYLSENDFGKIFQVSNETIIDSSDLEGIILGNGCNGTDIVTVGRPPTGRGQRLTSNFATSRNSNSACSLDSIYWDVDDYCINYFGSTPPIYIEFIDADDVRWFIEKESPLAIQANTMIRDGSTFDVSCFFDFSNFTDFVFAVTPCNDTISGSDIKINTNGVQDFNQLPICSGEGVIKLSLFENNGELEKPISIYFRSLGTEENPTFVKFENSSNLANKLGLNRNFLQNDDIGKTFQISCETIIDSIDLAEGAIFQNGCNATDIVGVGRPPTGKGRRLRSNLATSRNNTSLCFRDSISWVSNPDGCGKISEPVTIYLDIIDTIPPLFTYIPVDTVIKESELDLVNLSEPTVIEACGSYQLKLENIHTSLLPDVNQKILSKVWIATDDCGNTATATQKITILLESPSNCRPDCALQLPCPEDRYVVIPKGSNDLPITWTPPLPTQMNCAMETTECAPSPITGFKYIGAFQGSKYYLSDNRDDVADAIAITTANGGHLLTIDNGDESNFIQENITEVVHIGINDVDQEGVFKTTNGEMPTYLNWGSFFLNNAANNYAIFQPWDGTWSLVNKWVYKHFVLEIPCNTEIPSIALRQTGGPMNGTIMGAGTYTISYEAEVCNAKANCDFTLTVVEEANCGNDCQGVPYCESQGLNPWEEWIAHVELGSIHNTSSKEGFGDFTHLSTTLLAGQQYDMTVTSNFSWQNSPNYLQVWIDFNRNDQFEETELVRQEILQVLPNFERIRNRQFRINIPTTSKTGVTRMRVSLSRTNASNACGAITYGEVEDYSILLENASQSRSLPIDELHFRAFASDLKTDLQWVSNMGYKSNYFEVQRSTDGIDFVPIGQVDMASTDAALNSYQFEDKNPVFGLNYYRIRQIHTDNSYLLTAPQKVKFGNKSNSFTIFPNPASSTLFLNVPKSANIQLFNLLGQAQVIRQTTEITSDLLRVDLANVPSGIYYIMVKMEGKALTSQKVYIDQQE